MKRLNEHTCIDAIVNSKAAAPPPPPPHPFIIDPVLPKIGSKTFRLLLIEEDEAKPKGGSKIVSHLSALSKTVLNLHLLQLLYFSPSSSVPPSRCTLAFSVDIDRRNKMLRRIRVRYHS